MKKSLILPQKTKKILLCSKTLNHGYVFVGYLVTVIMCYSLYELLCGNANQSKKSLVVPKQNISVLKKVKARIQNYRAQTYNISSSHYKINNSHHIKYLLTF